MTVSESFDNRPAECEIREPQEDDPKYWCEGQFFEEDFLRDLFAYRKSVEEEEKGKARAQQTATSKLLRPPSDSDVKIDAGEEDLCKVSKQAWDAITRANTPNPRLYLFGSNPVRLQADEDGAPALKPLDANCLRFESARAARWVRMRGTAKRPTEETVKPPLDVIHDMLAHPAYPLPALDRIVTCPVFSRKGNLHFLGGYHEEGRVFLHETMDIAISSVPTPEEVNAARGLIGENLFRDFPFTGDAERAHAVALLLEPFVRDLIDGPVPLYLVEAPTPGTGKSLLVEVITTLFAGQPLGAITECTSEAEWRKKVFAKLRSGTSHVWIDNLSARFDSASMAAALTCPNFEDRILGKSATQSVPVRCTWIATGNNPTFSTELARRSVRIRLDSKTENAWNRDPSLFLHQDLRRWAKEHRKDLVVAALTIVQAWIAAGRPKSETVLGGFESWARTLGGILQCAGIPGFLANRQEFYEAADDEGGAIRELVARWYTAYTDRPISTAELWCLVENDVFNSFVGDGTAQSKKVKFGKLVNSLRDRVFSDVAVADKVVSLTVQDAGKYHQARLLKLQIV